MGSLRTNNANMKRVEVMNERILESINSYTKHVAIKAFDKMRWPNGISEEVKNLMKQNFEQVVEACLKKQ